MNLKTILESALLALLKMTEEEQKQLLFQWGIRLRLNIECSTCGRVLCDYESLPDLAERLWGEAIVLTSPNALYAVMKTKGICTENSQKWNASFWIFNALPIHRIVAALLAMKRADEAPTKSSVSGKKELSFTLYSIRKNR